MKKNKHRNLDFMQKIIDVKKIDPSPYQVRKHFDEDIFCPFLMKERKFHPSYRRKQGLLLLTSRDDFPRAPIHWGPD